MNLNTPFSSENEAPLSAEESTTFAKILGGKSKERGTRRNDFFDEISNPKASEKRKRFQLFLHSGESSRLFDVEEDEAAQRIMKMFEPQL